MNKEELQIFLFKNIDVESILRNELKQQIHSLHEYDLLLSYRWVLKHSEHQKPSYTLFNNFYSKYCKDRDYRTEQIKYKKVSLIDLRKSIFQNFDNCQEIAAKQDRDKRMPETKALTFKKEIKCKKCNNLLERKLKESLFDFKKRMFCNIKCSSQFVNTNLRISNLKKIIKQCQNCKMKLKCRDNERPHQFKKRMFCSKSCRATKMPFHRLESSMQNLKQYNQVC